MSAETPSELPDAPPQSASGVAAGENSAPAQPAGAERLNLRGYWDLLGPHIRPHRGLFASLLLLMLLSIAMNLINPQIMRYFIDQALAGTQLSILVRTALLFLLITLVQQGFFIFQRYTGEKLAWLATNALRGELAHHCLRLDMGFHQAHTPGEMIERIDGDVRELATFFSQFAVSVVGNFFLLLGILVMLYLEDWRVGLVFSVFSVAMVLTLVRLRNFAVAAQKEQRSANAGLYGFIEEQLGATEDIRSSGAVGYALREMHRWHGRLQQATWRANFRQWIPQSLMELFVLAGLMITLLSGYFLYTSAGLSVGTVFLLLRYFGLLEMPIWVLTHEMRNFQSIGACVERLTELRALRPLVQEGPLDVLASGALDLTFENVHFAYDADEPVLRGLSFQLPTGKILGVLGRTGSGKSTLARLVFRLYDPQSGEIRVEGRDVRELKLEALRGRVAMVTQDVQIFRASVRENLTFFDTTIPDAEILAAVDKVGLSDWLAAQSAGLDTPLHSAGRNLSAGEAQLLALARVFLRNPGLVVLDEASSRLDPSTEMRLERALNRLLEQRTVLIIAHRLGTVQRADSILILEEGNVLEFGERSRLAADPDSRFHHLLKTGLEEVLA